VRVWENALEKESKKIKRVRIWVGFIQLYITEDMEVNDKLKNGASLSQEANQTTP
jgi:hypothetical protein